MPAAKSIPPPTPEEWSRFWSKVEERLGGCWEWTAGTLRRGYGRFKLRGNTRQAHRVAYTWCVAPVDPELHLDHLCRNCGCVNPEHLEPVTCKMNLLRGEGRYMVAHRTDMCVRGIHPLVGANVVPNGRLRACRACRAETMSSRRSRLSPEELERRLNLGGVCKRGHKMVPDNTFVTQYASRECRECRRLLARESYVRRIESKGGMTR